MTKYAYLDPNDNSRVRQWLDTDAHNYNMPDVSMLHTCTDAEWTLQGAGDFMVQNGAIVPYVAPAPDVAQAKAAKWAEIKAERDRRISAGGYLAGGKWFHSDLMSRTQQLALYTLGSNIPANLQWKTMDGTFVPMTQSLAQQVFSAAAASDIAIFESAEAHKTAMEASADPSAYNYSTGWPLIYGEKVPA